MSYFVKRLQVKGIDPDNYLDIMRRIAKDAGYNPEDLQFSKKKGKKLVYQNVHFGNSNNNDFVIYYLTEGEQEAMKRRRMYLARATKIGGDWDDNPISPNNLAIRIIWSGLM
jgi:hypothetical protein